MTDPARTETEPAHQLWDKLKDSRAVMLGSPDRKQHMQPMAPQVDPDNECVWFFSSKSSELVKAVRADASPVHMCLVDGDYWACISGPLKEHFDEDVRDRFWGPVVAAYYSEGKEDPDLTLLRFEPEDAAIWVSGNPISFAWEVVKANLSKSVADTGTRAEVSF